MHFRLAATSLLAYAVMLLAVPQPASARVVRVTNVAELRAAIDRAQPGDEIVLARGEYQMRDDLVCDTAGTAERPIVVRSEELLGAHIRFDAIQGFYVPAPHWVFEDMDIEGVCADDSQCEHAFHIVGRADFTVVRGNRMREYNAQIKGNGAPVGQGGAMIWPNDVLIEYNELSNSRPRNTGNPVTPIDVVGGRRWVVRGNFIHDHAKGQGDGISYAAFFKGNSRDGIFERNLVACELLHRGRIRLGLSFGGGGSQPGRICEDGVCSPEHQNGIMRNNIIVNCPADVGIYLNEAQDAKIYNNTLYNNSGIDVRFRASTVDLRNNLMSGRIRNRDGGTSTKGSNLEQVSSQDFRRWFVDPDSGDFRLAGGSGSQIVDRGENLTDVVDDFCGHPRDDGAADIGAVEYGQEECDTRRPARANPVASPQPSPTRPPATRTPTPNPSATVTATPTDTPVSNPPRLLYLPWVQAG